MAMTAEDSGVELEPLLALARSASRCVKYQRMRELYPSILAARAALVPHKLIIRTLNAEYGLDIDAGTYNTYLGRLKNEATALTASPQGGRSEGADEYAKGVRPRITDNPYTTSVQTSPVTPARAELRFPLPAIRPSEPNSGVKPPGVSPAAWAAMQARQAAQRQKRR